MGSVIEAVHPVPGRYPARRLIYIVVLEMRAEMHCNNDRAEATHGHFGAVNGARPLNIIHLEAQTAHFAPAGGVGPAPAPKVRFLVRFQRVVSAA